MIRTTLCLFLELLDNDRPVFRRYAAMALTSGVLNALVIALTVPVLNHGLSGRLASALPWLAALICGTLLCWILRRRVEMAGIDVGVAVLSGLRLRLGNHVSRLPIGWFNSDNSGRLSHALTHGVMEVAQLPAHVFTPVLNGLVVPPVLALMLWALVPQIGVVALVALPLMALVFGAAARLGRTADAGFHTAAAETGQRAVEFARTQSVLRAFSGEGASTRFLQQAFAGQRRAGLRLIRLSTLSVVLNAWVLQAVFATALIVAVQLLNHGLTQAETLSLIVALVLVQRLLEPMAELAGYGEALRGARNHLETLAGIARTPPLPHPTHPQIPRDGSITLEGVHFRYSPEAPEVLQGLSLHIPAGSMTALIGSSGSGKTTIARLIARFFDVEQGQVCIGGVDVRDIAEADLAAQISQIFQDSYLIQGSLADNIRMGRPEATDAELAKVTHLAGVDEIAARLPEGVRTEVGEGGVRLSGGERQRITIARALLKGAPILLVDEATAALDTENQALVTQTLQRLHGTCTMIVIAHQLSTLQMADQIAVLDAGRIVEIGTPASLAQHDGPYARGLRLRDHAQGWRPGAAE